MTSYSQRGVLVTNGREPLISAAIGVRPRMPLVRPDSNAPFTTTDGDDAVPYSPGGKRIPEAVGLVISSGITVRDYKSSSASLRLRNFGPRGLTSDGVYCSKATTLLNAEVGYSNFKLTRDGVLWPNSWICSTAAITTLPTPTPMSPESRQPPRQHSQTFSTPSNRFRCDSR